MARWLVRALVVSAVLAVGLVPGSARASVSIAVTWDRLLAESSVAAIVTPIDGRSVWEGDRIYTYTHVRVERALAGELSTGSDAWVRTMGGVVGKIGQVVDGEAVLAPGQKSLLFLHPAAVAAFDVTARGQGQFPLVPTADPKTSHLVRSTSAGSLVAPRTGTPSPPVALAADVVHGRPVDDVALDVAAAWPRTHGH